MAVRESLAAARDGRNRPMNTDRWQRVKDLFSQACERAPEERGSFLAEACRGDEELRREVSSLLESHQETGSVFDKPVAPAIAARVDPLARPFLRSTSIIRQIGRVGFGLDCFLDSAGVRVARAVRVM